MVMISVLVLLGLGPATATVLAVASRVFHVEEDPRVQAVLEALPGANCGGCGYAGCEGLCDRRGDGPRRAREPLLRRRCGNKHRGGRTDRQDGGGLGIRWCRSAAVTRWRATWPCATIIRVCLRVRRPPVWWAVRIRAPIRASASGTACRCAPSTPSKCGGALRE